MTQDTNHSTDDRSDNATLDGIGVERRPLLKALGIGATLSLGSARVGAEQNDARIDSRYGYSTPNADDIPEALQPDHEVQLLVAPPDGAGSLPFFAFDPTGLHVAPGDVVQFTFASPDHTVTAYHPGNGFQRRVPENVPPFSSPVVNVGGAWLYRFDQPGVYDLYCGPHHPFGMVGRLVVGTLDETALPDYVNTFEGNPAGEPPVLAPYSREMFESELNDFGDENEDAEWVWVTPVEILSTDALAPTAIQDAGTVPFSAVRNELGRDGTQTTTR